MRIWNHVTGFAAIAVVALAAAGPSRAAGLTNGGFETGSLSGWTETGNTNLTGVNTIHPHSGAYDAFFGNSGSDATISQTISFTAGTSLTIGGYLYASTATTGPGNVTNDFSILFNGTPILSMVYGPQSYTFESATATATGGNDTIAFAFRNDQGQFDFDDAVVTPATAAVPEPATALLLGTGVLGALAFRRKSAGLSAKTKRLASS